MNASVAVGPHVIVHLGPQNGQVRHWICKKTMRLRGQNVSFQRSTSATMLSTQPVYYIINPISKGDTNGQHVKLTYLLSKKKKKKTKRDDQHMLLSQKITTSLLPLKSHQKRLPSKLSAFYCTIVPSCIYNNS